MASNGTKTQFKPGLSGNPGGRPKAIVQVAAAARERTPEALEVLSQIMRNRKATDSARVRAAEVLLERGWGKAPQTISLKKISELSGMTDEELIAIAGGTDAETEDGSADYSAAAENPAKPN